MVLLMKKYPELFDAALAIAADAHQGQVDRGGAPFITHPLRVMHNMETPEERLVALLHDTIEDSDVTVTDLQVAGFSANVINAVLALTRWSGESYLSDYIDRVGRIELARWVKVKDLEDNMMIGRLETFTPKDLARVAKYKTAWNILKGVNR